MIVKNDLFDYENKYIFQDTEYFKFSLDSVLLAEYAKKDLVNGPILEMCAGNSVISMILTIYTNNEIVNFEIQEKIHDLAKLSINENNLKNKITLINDDIKNIGNYYKKNYFKNIICNPPYFEYNGQMGHLTYEKRIARHEVAITLEEIFKISKDYLENNGHLYIINRSQRLDELFVLANKYNINVKEVQFVKTKETEKPSLVIIKCIKNSKKHVIINDIICINNMKSYKNIFK